MKTLTLALRNLERNRRRSLTTLLAMIVGACSILLFGGYSRNITYGLQTNYAQRTGHLQIQHKDYFLYGSGNPGAYGIANYEQIIRTIKADPVLAPMLTVVTPTLQLGGIAGNFSAGVSRTIIGTGVVVEDFNQMRLWNDYQFPLRPRTEALSGTAHDAVVIGNGVARVLQLCEPLNVKNCPQPLMPVKQDGAGAPNDIIALSALEQPNQRVQSVPRIEVLAANAHGAPNVASLQVVKAEAQALKELDDILISMHLSQAQRLIYGTEAPKVTAIILQLQHTSQLPEAKARMRQLLTTTFKDEPLDIQDFMTLNPFYGQSLSMFSVIFGFIAVLIGAIVLFTIGNTMSMAVVERTVEIGTLRAIGLRQSGIHRIFVVEGFALGTLGAILGILTSLVLAFVINHSGISYYPPGRVEPVPLTVHVWGETSLLLGAAVSLIIVAVLSAWWPAKRASRMNIVDALRHV